MLKTELAYICVLLQMSVGVCDRSSMLDILVTGRQESTTFLRQPEKRRRRFQLRLNTSVSIGHHMQ